MGKGSISQLYSHLVFVKQGPVVVPLKRVPQASMVQVALDLDQLGVHGEVP